MKLPLHRNDRITLRGTSFSAATGFFYLALVSKSSVVIVVVCLWTLKPAASSRKSNYECRRASDSLNMHYSLRCGFALQ